MMPKQFPATVKVDEGKRKRAIRAAGGEVWEDPLLADWPDGMSSSSSSLHYTTHHYVFKQDHRSQLFTSDFTSLSLLRNHYVIIYILHRRFSNFCWRSWQ